jgi:hypothetical protein
VIPQDAFTVGPWSLRETHLDPDLLAQTGSVFALAVGDVWHVSELGYWRNERQSPSNARKATCGD